MQGFSVRHGSKAATGDPIWEYVAHDLQLLLLFQLPAEVNPRRQEVMAQVLWSLKIVWKIPTELGPDLTVNGIRDKNQLINDAILFLSFKYNNSK